ncbi:hypothetical protein [Halorubrum vacuolatum]|nr:hypothetical protein [Halorubrum vacuolatum]
MRRYTCPREIDSLRIATTLPSAVAALTSTVAALTSTITALTSAVAETS